MINVLHLLDVAGISSIINHYHNKMNFGNSQVFYHEKKSFSYSISKFYEGKSFRKYRKLVLSALTKNSNYDIIHIHGAEMLIPLFKITGRKIVLHYHGSDIRHPGRAESKKRIFCRSLADLILYNSKNMEERIITNKSIPKIFIRNLIDTEHFSIKSEKMKDCLVIVSSNHDKNKILEKTKEFENVDIIDLDKIQIPYRFMPNLLSKYKMYLDIRIMPWGEQLEELSTTALQALSCGCKVYINGKILNSLPKESTPKYYLSSLNNLYNKLNGVE